MCAHFELHSLPKVAGDMTEPCEDRPPVRNTFIHFDVPAYGGKRRTLRRNQTDPADACVAWPEAPLQTPRSPEVTSAKTDLFGYGPAEFGIESPISIKSTEDDGMRTPDMLSYDFTFSNVSSDDECQDEELAWRSIPPRPVSISLSNTIHAPYHFGHPDVFSKLCNQQLTGSHPSGMAESVSTESTCGSPEKTQGLASKPEWTPKTPECCPEWTPEPALLFTPPPFPSWACASMPMSSFMFTQGGLGVRFNFTLRRAPGVGVGLDLVRAPDDRSLIVQSVLPCGAMEAWNRQAIAGPNGGKAVVPGDRLVRVNESSDCDAMLGECQDKVLLKLSFARGNVDGERQPMQQSSESAQWSSTMGVACDDRQTCGNGCEPMGRARLSASVA